MPILMDSNISSLYAERFPVSINYCSRLIRNVRLHTSSRLDNKNQPYCIGLVENVRFDSNDPSARKREHGSLSSLSMTFYVDRPFPPATVTMPYRKLRECRTNGFVAVIINERLCPLIVSRHNLALLFFFGSGLFAAIVAAFGAYSVVKYRRTAVRAGRHRGSHRFVVRSSFISSLFRDLVFRMCHFCILIKLFYLFPTFSRLGIETP